MSTKNGSTKCAAGSARTSEATAGPRNPPRSHQGHDLGQPERQRDVVQRRVVPQLQDGDEWKSSSSFGRDELLTVAKVADLANSWIHGQAQAPANDGHESEQPDEGIPYLRMGLFSRLAQAAIGANTARWFAWDRSILGRSRHVVCPFLCPGVFWGKVPVEKMKPSDRPTSVYQAILSLTDEQWARWPASYSALSRMILTLKRSSNGSSRPTVVATSIAPLKSTSIATDSLPCWSTERRKSCG